VEFCNVFRGFLEVVLFVEQDSFVRRVASFVAAISYIGCTIGGNPPVQGMRRVRICE